MSKFFSLCSLTFFERHQVCNDFEVKLNSQFANLNGQRIYTESSDYRESYSNLLIFAGDFDSILSNNLERIILLNILFKSEKDKNLSVKESIYKSFIYLKNALLGLPYTDQPVDAFLTDARNAGEDFENQVDLILTSPPYINVFNYHQNYRAIVEAFQFDVLKVAHSEFGSNRKNRGNRFKTVIQYCLDMELSIRSFWKTLKPGATMIMVVGRESNVRGTPFYNGQIVIEIIERGGGFSLAKNFERTFVNKFGNSIKEDIIVATKTGNLSDDFYGREISVEHLRKSLQRNQSSIKLDIQEAIENNRDINSSPLFNSKDIIKK